MSGIANLEEFEREMLAELEIAAEMVRAELIDAVADVHAYVLAHWPVDTGYSLAAFDAFPDQPEYSTPSEARGSSLHNPKTEGEIRAKLKAAGAALRRAYYTCGAFYSGWVEGGTTKMEGRYVVEAALAQLREARRAAA